MPTKGKKSGKANQNGKEELTKVQNQKNSELPLKSTPPNTLNASSPP
jgi:hypothetical protein